MGVTYTETVLIHRWDAARDAAEWKAWLAEGRDFGQLVVGPLDDGYPGVIPLHFRFDGVRTVEAHLAAANPVWSALQTNPLVTLSVVDDYAYVPGAWRAAPEVPAEHGVPTSYYATVQLRGQAEIVDDLDAKAEILNRQLTHHCHQGVHVVPGERPYGPMLAGIRGIRLHVHEVVAKFKYDDQKPAQHRERVARALEARNTSRDTGARTQLLRRSGID